MTTLSDVARMRLISQRLVDPMATAIDVVRHLTCTQGQDYPGSTTSIALRMTSRRLADVRDAYDAADIVRSWPMRGTLFVVPAVDLGWMLGLTSEKVLRESERRRAELGLDEATLMQAESIAREALTGSGRAVPGLSRADLLARWQEAGIEVGTGRGYHLIFHLAVRGVICLGPTEGTAQNFVLTEEWIGAPRVLEREEAVTEWFTRYVLSHGPVPVVDFLWWTKLLKRDLAPVLGTARAEFEVIKVVGAQGGEAVEHWVSPGVLEAYPGTRQATSAPLLLPGFDELVLGYGDRRAILSKQEEALVVPGRNGVFRGTVVRGGTALGTWRRPTRRGAAVSVEPFAASLPPVVERALPAQRSPARLSHRRCPPRQSSRHGRAP